MRFKIVATFQVGGDDSKGVLFGQLSDPIQRDGAADFYSKLPVKKHTAVMIRNNKWVRQLSLKDAFNLFESSKEILENEAQYPDELVSVARFVRFKALLYQYLNSEITLNRVERKEDSKSSPQNINIDKLADSLGSEHLGLFAEQLDNTTEPQLKIPNKVIYEIVQDGKVVAFLKGSPSVATLREKFVSDMAFYTGNTGPVALSLLQADVPGMAFSDVLEKVKVSLQKDFPDTHKQILEYKWYIQLNQSGLPLNTLLDEVETDPNKLAQYFQGAEELNQIKNLLEEKARDYAIDELESSEYDSSEDERDIGTALFWAYVENSLELYRVPKRDVVMHKLMTDKSPLKALKRSILMFITGMGDDRPGNNHWDPKTGEMRIYDSDICMIANASDLVQFEDENGKTGYRSQFMSLAFASPYFDVHMTEANFPGLEKWIDRVINGGQIKEYLDELGYGEPEFSEEQIAGLLERIDAIQNAVKDGESLQDVVYESYPILETTFNEYRYTRGTVDAISLLNINVAHLGKNNKLKVAASRDDSDAIEFMVDDAVRMPRPLSTPTTPVSETSGSPIHSSPVPMVVGALRTVSPLAFS